MAAPSRVYTLPRWKQWQYSLRIWLPPSLLLLLFTGLFIFLCCIVPSLDMIDVRGTAIHHDRSMVSDVSYIPLGRGAINPSCFISLAVAGETVTLRTHADLHKGEPVQVTYRIGKSGRIHIDGIEPEGKTKP